MRASTAQLVLLAALNAIAQQVRVLANGRLEVQNGGILRVGNDALATPQGQVTAAISPPGHPPSQPPGQPPPPPLPAAPPIGSQLAELAHASVASTDYFGCAVAACESMIVVGAYGEDSEAGAAYVFTKAGELLTRLSASDAEASDYFGYSVACDNITIVVGAYGVDDAGSMSGAAYLFNSSGAQLAKLTASDGAASHHFGKAVAISGSKVVVGRIAGGAYLFDTEGTLLKHIQPPGGGGFQPRSVAMSDSIIFVGDTSQVRGRVLAFDISGNYLHELRPSDAAESDAFGWSVALSGDWLAVGAPSSKSSGAPKGKAYLFHTPSPNLVQAGNGAAGSSKIGDAWYYRYETYKLVAAGARNQDRFGTSVAVNRNGTVVVGAPERSVDDRGISPNGYKAGTAEVFDAAGNEMMTLANDDLDRIDHFGHSVAMHGATIVVGAIGYRLSQYYYHPGGAYIFSGPPPDVSLAQ